MVKQHFTPLYRPWDQRLCVAPDGDLFSAIGSGTVTVVTDQIDRFLSDGIRLASGRKLRADVIISATGLVLRPAGGIALQVDHRRIDLGESHDLPGDDARRVPNLVYTFGYVNSSWTLRSDMIARWVCRFLRYLRRRGFRSGTPSAKSVEPDKGFFRLTPATCDGALGFSTARYSGSVADSAKLFLGVDLVPIGTARSANGLHKTPRGAKVSGASSHSGPVSV